MDFETVKILCDIVLPLAGLTYLVLTIISIKRGYPSKHMEISRLSLAVVCFAASIVRINIICIILWGVMIYFSVSELVQINKREKYFKKISAEINDVVDVKI